MRYAWLVPLLLVFASACAEQHNYSEGEICVDAPALASFAAGDEVEFVVVLDDCMACPKDFTANCDVERQGSTITLHAGGVYTERSGPCDSCLTLSIACVVGGLEPGNYTVRSGDQTLEISLPQAEAPKLDATCDAVKW